MKKFTLLLSTIVLISLNSCAQDIPNKATQIAAAVMAAPENDRDGAMVYGYDKNGKLVTLREGSNSLICIANDPNKENFQTVCYHKDLEPFMTRGRELKAAGKKFQEIFDMREAEAKSGKLQLPEQPTTMHLLEGSEDAFYDEASGEVKNASYRYVVYIPWATAESTGLPLKPLLPGHPWIMNPGTHRAHIMITPPKEK